MGTTFRDQLVATRDRKHGKDHAFFDLWAQGKLTKEQTAIYCAQHYHYVNEYLNWMAYEASQVPFNRRTCVERAHVIGVWPARSH